MAGLFTRSCRAEYAAKLAEKEREQGVAEVSEKFIAAGGEVYVAEE